MPNDGERRSELIVICYQLLVNRTVGQARRLPIHRMASGALALQIRYQRSVYGYRLSGRSALTTWIKHGAAAICAATMARILSFDRARDRFVQLELIIVRQFFARADVA